MRILISRCLSVPLLLIIVQLIFPVDRLRAVENGGEKALNLPPMHHSVRMAVPQGMTIDTQVRLNERDEIDCISCHGIADIAEIPLDQIDRESPDFFVGGPYPANQMMGAFCVRCHDSKESERTNIHILLDSNGALIENRCTFCHLEVPDTQPSTRMEEGVDVVVGQVNERARLRLPAQKLCYGCHLKTPHLKVEVEMSLVD